jgi:hypothetical protein
VGERLAAVPAGVNDQDRGGRLDLIGRGRVGDQNTGGQAAVRQQGQLPSQRGRIGGTGAPGQVSGPGTHQPLVLDRPAVARRGWVSGGAPGAPVAGREAFVTPSG